MAKPLVTIAVAGFAVSAFSFLAAGVLFASGAVGAVIFDDAFNWDSQLPRCVNELGDAGEESATREFAWMPGDGIQLIGPGVTRYRPGSTNSVIVKGPAYLLAHAEIDGSSVAFDCNPRGRAREVEAEFVGNGVAKFTVVGSGDMILEDLDQESVEISITGSGSIEAAGSVGSLSLSLMGSGDALLGELQAQRVEVSLTGSGDATVSPTDSVDASIMGSGDVQLLTNPPDIHSSTMGSGELVRAGSGR